MSDDSARWFVQTGGAQGSGVVLCDYHRRVWALAYPEYGPARQEPFHWMTGSCYQCRANYLVGTWYDRWKAQDDAIIAMVSGLTEPDYARLAFLLSAARGLEGPNGLHYALARVLRREGNLADHHDAAARKESRDDDHGADHEQ